MKFQKAFVEMIEHEGGWVNDKNDPGGESKYGVSKRSYPTLNISRLTLLDAQQLYLSDFWLPHEYDRIISDDVASKVFSMTVNAGEHSSHKILQRALEACRKKLKWDGLLGDKTFAATNDVSEEILLPALRSEQASYYERLMARKPEMGRYRTGWLKRAYS